MHRQIDAPFRQRVLDLLGEHALGSDLRERDVENLVARGLDNLQLDFVPLFDQQGGNVFGLPQGKHGATGANS